MKVKILKPSRLDGRDLPVGKTTNLPDELVPSWIKADLIKIVNPKRSGDTTKKQGKPGELINLKREELLSLLEKIGLDIEIAKSMSEEELIEIINEGTSEETQSAAQMSGDRESDLSNLSKKKLMAEGAKSGLDWKEMKSLSKEEIIVKIEESRKSQEESTGEGSEETDPEAGNSGQETS